MRLNLNRFVLAAAFFLMTISAMAQQKVVLKGAIFEAKTGLPLRNASIRNLNTGSTMVSHSEGRFSITGNKGNILSFSATGYFTDTLTLTDSVLALDKLSIQLRVLPNTLPEVVVSARFNPYQIDSIKRRQEFLALVGEREVPAVSRANNLGFGVGINLDRFSKKEKGRRAARTLFDITEEEAYINYRWSDTMVNRYTRFTGDELSQFMQEYRPSWDWLRDHTSYEDVFYYINRSLKKRRKTQ